MMTLTNDNQEYAVVPMADYKTMLSLKEDFDDTLLIEKARQEVEQGTDELIPFAITKRLIAGESKLKVWREYRGLTPAQLNKSTGISVSVISKIENGKQEIDLPKLKKLTTALQLDFDDLID